MKVEASPACKKFSFKNTLPASKSILNRALIVKDYFPELNIVGDSTCDDVMFMRRALSCLQKQKNVDCGEGGTTFRFLVLRASRIPGEHFIQGSRRLMLRPQQELIEILGQLGVRAELNSEGIALFSQGWKVPVQPVIVNASESSQYASALLLNSWLLDFELNFKIVGEKLSKSYFAMTRDLVTQLGMQLSHVGNDSYSVPAGQKISEFTYTAEPDLSSAFVFAAAGALYGECEILNFPENSLQPDIAFASIFSKMNIPCKWADGSLIVKKSVALRPIDFDLSQAPDLFPVLAVLCSFAEGKSRLHGAPHLAVKESNRIQKVADLFDIVGVDYKKLVDGMIIDGRAKNLILHDFKHEAAFDTAHDHRMVMAATLLQRSGQPFRVLHPESVKKSLPEFFELFGATT